MELETPPPYRFLRCLAGVLVLDAAYFRFVASYVYPPMQQVRLGYGLIAWSALAWAIAALKPESQDSALMYGIAVGGVTYAVFNGTELAIRADWRAHWSYGVIDMVWGMLACGIVSSMVHRFE